MFYNTFYKIIECSIDPKSLRITAVVKLHKNSFQSVLTYLEIKCNDHYITYSIFKILFLSLESFMQKKRTVFIKIIILFFECFENVNKLTILIKLNNERLLSLKNTGVNSWCKFLKTVSKKLIVRTFLLFSAASSKDHCLTIPYRKYMLRSCLNYDYSLAQHT